MPYLVCSLQLLHHF